MYVYVSPNLQRVNAFGKESGSRNGIGGVLKDFNHIFDVSFLFPMGLPEGESLFWQNLVVGVRELVFFYFVCIFYMLEVFGNKSV